MEDIKALFYFEVDHLAVYLNEKLTFRKTAMKTSMDWPLILLFVDTYKDYQQFMTPEMQIAAEQLKKTMSAEHNSEYGKYRIHPYRYMNLFGTWGPDPWDYLGGMVATYWKKDNRCGLKDIAFGERQTDAILDLSRSEFFHFISNWLINHDWWIVHELNLEKHLNSNGENAKITELENRPQYKDFEIHLRDYMIHYLLDIHEKLLKDELSLEYLLSLDGIHTVGALLASKRIREKYGRFFKNLLDSKDMIPRGWKVALAIILENVIHHDYPDFHYIQLKELQIDAQAYEMWAEELECDDFQIFEKYDEFMQQQK